jgi:diguanylate cyclase (GGDEF)-like protein
MKRKTKTLIVLSLVLLVTDLGFLAINYVSAKGVLNDTVQERGASLRDGFEIALYTTELKLTEIAAFVAGIPEVKADLAAAAQAVAAGDEAAADREREALLGVVGPRWKALQFKYLLRQFSFYVLPGSTAFLRVQQPYEYGDQITDPTSPVVTAMRSAQPQNGFAIDRLSTGVRGVAPIEIGDGTNGTGGRVAAIEVGSSFDMMLIPICPASSCGISVLLSDAQVRAAMDGEVVGDYFTPDRRWHNWFIEAASNPALTRALLAADPMPDPKHREVHLIRVADRWFSVTYFPLSDYRSRHDAAAPSSGVVVGWQDLTDRVNQFNRTQAINLAFAVTAFIVMEVLLWLLINMVTRRLEQEISTRTQEVNELLARVSVLANRDGLTELFNRRFFDERLLEEIGRAGRSRVALSLILLDLDHFKRINDGYGHPMGDAVLIKVADVIRTTCRSSDVPGRYGGEEFAIILPETSGQHGAELADRLRTNVEKLDFSALTDRGLRISVSAGVAEWQPGMLPSALLRHADIALYEAKSQGRNRVILRTPPTAEEAPPTDIATSTVLS